LGTPPNLIGFAEDVLLRAETFLDVTAFCFLETGFDLPMAIFLLVYVNNDQPES